jgi:hypothetical protein
MRWALVGVLVSACSFNHGLVTSGGDASDGPVMIDATPDAPPDAYVPGPWGTPAMLFAGGGDDDPTLTGDMLELYFNRNADIYLATRSDVGQPWSTPTLVNELSSIYSETTPEITYDGLTIFVASTRIGGFGADDIYVSTRASRTDAWATPVQVPELSTSAEDAASAPTSDLLDIVLTSNPTAVNADLYRAHRTSTTASWSTPAPLTALNSASDDFSPMLTDDKLTIYFDSFRAGTDDLYVATRASTSASFSTPTPITELNTVGSESDPWISPDNRHLFFTRDGSLYESTR